MNKKKYELIFCIVNAGFALEVMEAAKKAGATGGTIIRGRGTANPEAEEFYQIAIQPDKEILWLIVPKEIKYDVMHRIYQQQQRHRVLRARDPRRGTSRRRARQTA